MRHDDPWYKEKLVDYIDENYSEYENDSEWFVNPAPNQFKGYFKKDKVLVLFTCDDDGTVTVAKFPLTMDLDILHEVVNGCTRGMDAAYEDYIIDLVGEEGFWILRKNRILEPCGSIDGRNLFTVN